MRNCIFVGMVFVGLVTKIAMANYLPAISGHLTTVSGKPIGGVSLFLESSYFLTKLTTDKDGYYFLPEAILFPRSWVKIFIPPIVGNFASRDSDSYFRAKMRAPVSVDSSKPIIVDFLMIESANVVDWGNSQFLSDYGGIPETLDGGNSRFSYNQIELNESSGEEVVIEYGYREEKRNQDVYRVIFDRNVKMKNGESYPGCSLTYHEYTFYAGGFIHDTKKKLINANGDIYVDTGKGLTKINHMTISYSGKKVVVSY